jgi:hypothetical protein
MDKQSKPTTSLGSVQPQWGKANAEHFGYASDEDRKVKRGLEDWELVEKIPESQKPVPYWFFAVVAVVVLVGVGLSFPFWGLRPGDERPWIDWGFLVAIVYMAGAGYFVWYMVRMYGSSKAGRLDSDPEKEKPEDDH